MLYVERVSLSQEQGNWHRVQDRAAERDWYDAQQDAQGHRVDGDEWPKLTSEMQQWVKRQRTSSERWRIFSASFLSCQSRGTCTLSAIWTSRHGKKKKVSFHFESDTLSDHERTDVIKTEDTAECQEEDARMGTKIDTVRGWERKDSDTEVDHVGDTFEDRTFDPYYDLREVIIRFLRVTKKSMSMMRSDLVNITTNLVRIQVERDKRVHKDKCEDSIFQEEFVLSCLSTSSKTKARVRVRTKTKEFIGTAKNDHHSIGCSNDQQNSWTEAMLLERSTGLKIWQECRLRVGHRKVQLEWRKGKSR